MSGNPWGLPLRETGVLMLGVFSGPKAKELLLEEKRRIASRLSNLKQSLCALTDSGKKQAEQVHLTYLHTKQTGRTCTHYPPYL